MSSSVHTPPVVVTPIQVAYRTINQSEVPTGPADAIFKAAQVVIPPQQQQS